jgi:uncharacterized protein
MRKLLLVAVLYLIACAGLGVWLADVAVKPLHRALTADAIARARAAAGEVGASMSDVSISADDRATLRGWVFTPAHPNGQSALVLHGVSGTRASVISYASILLRAGYTVLTPDARAHGASDGSVVTYGVLERDDLQRWIAWLRGRTSGCVHAFGSSMGAAQLLQVVDRPDLLCSVVVESPFATFREVAYDRVGQYVGIGDWLGRYPLRPAVELGLLTAQIRYRVDLTLADPMGHLQRTRVPVLLIHGLDDTNIPPRHAQLLMHASNPAAVTLWLVKGARHGKAWQADPKQFPTRLLAFFADHQQITTNAATATVAH